MTNSENPTGSIIKQSETNQKKKKKREGNPRANKQVEQGHQK